MCDCRSIFEKQAEEMYPEIDGAKANLSGYMLIPSGYQYLECEVLGTRATPKGKIVKSKKTINVLGKFCMFCGDKFKKDEE